MCAVDGTGNVQKAAEKLSIWLPRITVIHGAEHALDLFYNEVYSTVEEFCDIKILTRAVRNVFGSTRHKPTAMFRKQSRKHNRGVGVMFIKPSECR